MEALERTANPFGLFTTMSAARAVYPKKTWIAKTGAAGKANICSLIIPT